LTAPFRSSTFANGVLLAQYQQRFRALKDPARPAVLLLKLGHAGLRAAVEFVRNYRR
jgi:hypothetical protein